MDYICTMYHVILSNAENLTTCGAINRAPTINLQIILPFIVTVVVEFAGRTRKHAAHRIQQIANRRQTNPAQHMLRSFL